MNRYAINHNKGNINTKYLNATEMVIIDKCFVFHIPNDNGIIIPIGWFSIKQFNVRIVKNKK